jgi:hypothetical protein
MVVFFLDGSTLSTSRLYYSPRQFWSTKEQYKSGRRKWREPFFKGDNPHYSSLVPPSIPRTRLVILWDVLMGNPIFSRVLKNLASPSEIQSSLPRLESLTPCQYLPGQKLIANASPATSQFPQPRPGKIANATTSPSISRHKLLSL